MTKMEHNKFYYSLMLCVIAVITTDIKPVQGQRVDTDPRNVTVLEGQKADILCRWGQPLQYCRIQVPGERVLILSQEWNKTPGFTYFGSGLDKGQCGVTIQQVKAINHGDVRCFLGSDGDELEATIPLVVALAPLQPELEVHGTNRRNIFEIGEKFTAKCISRDGRPPSTISWYLDDEPINDGLGLVEIVESLASNNTTLYTSSQTITKYIRASDDRRHLICRTTHIAGQPQDARIQFQVRYRPQPLPQVKVFGVILSTTALINVTVHSNPRPTTQWIVDGVSIPQGTQNGRYESYEPLDLGNGIFNVTLSIAGLTLEDTTKEYRLKASNEFGTEDYIVRISSSEAAADAGLDVGSIIGIVVGVGLLIVIISLIVIARVTGKWCFSEKPPTSTLPHPSETSDTESADVKSSKLKKYNLNFEGFFKKKPQKLPTDVEQNAEGAEDPNDDAAPSEATVIMEDDPPKSAEKNLVYAELMLKPSDTDNPNKNATEYAEIVYVTPPTDEKPSTKKK